MNTRMLIMLGGIAFLAWAWGLVLRSEFRRWLRDRRIRKALALVKREVPEFDADAAQCLLERDRQRKHGEQRDDHDDFSGPTLMAA